MVRRTISVAVCDYRSTFTLLCHVMFDLDVLLTARVAFTVPTASSMAAATELSHDGSSTFRACNAFKLVLLHHYCHINKAHTATHE